MTRVNDAAPCIPSSRKHSIQIRPTRRQGIPAFAASRCVASAFGHSNIHCRAAVLRDSDSDEVRYKYEHGADDCQQNRIDNEIRKDHERQPANQWHDGLMLLTVQEVSESEGAEQQTPEKPPLVQFDLKIPDAEGLTGNTSCVAPARYAPQQFENN